MDYSTNQVRVRERLQRYLEKELMILGTLGQRCLNLQKTFILENLSQDKLEGTMGCKSSGRYADFLRDIRGKMVKPVFMSDNSWTKFTSYWGTSKYKETQEKKYTKSSKRIRFLNSYRRESIYKCPTTRFQLFLHTHTSDNDKKTFINEKSKTINDKVLRLRQEREKNPASAESQVDETTLHIATAGGAMRRNLHGAGSKRVYYIKDIDSGNKTTAVTKVDNGWEKKSMKMERKINKLNKLLRSCAIIFNITLPDCDSDSGNSSDGGDAHQDPNTSHSRAGGREEDDHDSRMIVSS